MNTSFNRVKSVLAHKFIIFQEHVNLTEQPRQNIFLQLGIKLTGHQIHISESPVSYLSETFKMTLSNYTRNVFLVSGLSFRFSGLLLHASS